MCVYCDYCVYHYKSTELVSLIYIGYWTLNKYYYYYYYVCFYVCCSDCVGVCGNVCCVAAVVKYSIVLALEC